MVEVSLLNKTSSALKGIYMVSFAPLSLSLFLLILVNQDST